MRFVTVLFLFFSNLASASLHTMAMIQNGVVVNTAVWDDNTTWNPGSQYTLVDVTGTSVGIGYTCTKCDGTDFVAPNGN